jgi:hypothetical protein
VFGAFVGEVCEGRPTVRACRYPSRGCLADVNETVLVFSDAAVPFDGLVGSAVVRLPASAWASLMDSSADGESSRLAAIEAGVNGIGSNPVAEPGGKQSLLDVPLLGLAGVGLVGLGDTPADGGIVVLSVVADPEVHARGLSHVVADPCAADAPDGACALAGDGVDAVLACMVEGAESSAEAMASFRSIELLGGGGAGGPGPWRPASFGGGEVDDTSTEGFRAISMVNGVAAAAIVLAHPFVPGEVPAEEVLPSSEEVAPRMGRGGPALLVPRLPSDAAAVHASLTAQALVLAMTGGICKALVGDPGAASDVLDAFHQVFDGLSLDAEPESSAAPTAAPGEAERSGATLAAVAEVSGRVVHMDDTAEFLAVLGRRGQAFHDDAMVVAQLDGQMSKMSGTVQLLLSPVAEGEAGLVDLMFVSGEGEEEARAAVPKGYVVCGGEEFGGNLIDGLLDATFLRDLGAVASPRVVVLCGRKGDEGDHAPLVDASLLVRAAVVPDASVGADELLGAAETLPGLPRVFDDVGGYEWTQCDVRVVIPPSSEASESKNADDDASPVTQGTLVRFWLATTRSPEAALAVRQESERRLPLGEAEDDLPLEDADEGEVFEEDSFQGGAGEEELRAMEEEAAAEATAALEAERRDLAARLEGARAANARLSSENGRLQRAARVYFLERERSAARGSSTVTVGGADREARYTEMLGELRGARQRFSLAEASFGGRAGQLESLLRERRAALDDVRAKLQAQQAEVCSQAVYLVTNQGISRREMNAWAKEVAGLREMISLSRSTMILASRRRRRLENVLKARKSVGEGLSIIDFEQLKIENATIHEKIEDRQEELRKLRAKTTTTVQVLTHVREKLQFVQAEADALHAKAAAVEAEVASQRSMLASSKRARERVKELIDKRKTARGFAHNDALAIDFEQRKQESVAMGKELADLRRKYTSLQQRSRDTKAELDALIEQAQASGLGDVVAAALR